MIGIGNLFRRDDAVGLTVARRLRGCVPEGTRVVRVEGDPMEILECCAGAETVVVIDAVRSGRRPGTVCRFDASRDPLPTHLFGATSTHAVGLADVVELGRALGALPPRVIVYGVEGKEFGVGQGLSEEVAAAVEAVVGRVSSDVAALTREEEGARVVADDRPDPQS